jgi:hypothetical protein
MKSLLKSLRGRIRFYRQCYLDSKRFLDSISPAKLGREAAVARIESDVVRQYHVIEKGLSMPDFRPGFGKDMVQGLVRPRRAARIPRATPNHRPRHQRHPSGKLP